MKYLLDTHTFLWAALAPKKLSPPAVAAIQQTDSELFLSVASLWEIAILQSLGRIELGVSIPEIVELAEFELATTLLAIEPVHIDKVRNLPFHHRDPFDRLLIAQSLSVQTSVIGRDDCFDLYGVQRVW